MSDAIVAKLGLDLKDFRKELGLASEEFKKFAKKQKSSVGEANAASTTLGRTFKQVGQSWVSGVVGVMGGAMAWSSIHEGIKAARELRKTLEGALQHTSANFSSVDEMRKRLEQTNSALQQSDSSLSSTMGRTMLELSGMADAMGQFLDNPMGVLSGKKKIKLRDPLKDVEAQDAALRKQQLDLQTKIAQKETDALATKWKAFKLSSQMAEEEEAARKRDEAIGGAQGLGKEAREKTRSNAQSAYDLEIAAIRKKHDMQREDLALQKAIMDLQGTAAQKNISALRLEIEMQRKRLEQRGGEMTIEEKGAAGVKIQQAQKSLKEAEADEFMKTPRQREQERLEAQKRRQALRVMEKRGKGRGAARARRDGDEFDSAFVGKGNPSNALNREGLPGGDISARARSAAGSAEFRRRFNREGFNAVSRTGQAESGNSVQQDILKVLRAIEKKKVSNL